MTERRLLHELVNSTMNSSWSNDMSDRQIVAHVIDTYGPTQKEKKRVRSLVYKGVKKWRKESDAIRKMSTESTQDLIDVSVVAKYFPEFVNGDVVQIVALATTGRALS